MRTFLKDPSFLKNVRDKLYLLGGIGHVVFVSGVLWWAIFAGFLELAFSGHGQIGEHSHQVSGSTISVALLGVLGMGLVVPYFAVRRWAKPLLIGIYALVFLGGVAGAYKIHLDYRDALQADEVRFGKRSGTDTNDGISVPDYKLQNRNITIGSVVLPSFLVLALLSAGRKREPDENQDS